MDGTLALLVVSSDNASVKDPMALSMVLSAIFMTESLLSSVFECKFTLSLGGLV